MRKLLWALLLTALVMVFLPAAFAQEQAMDFSAQSARKYRPGFEQAVSAPRAGPPAGVVADFLRARGHGQPTLDSLVTEIEEHAPGGLTHLWLSQQVDGLEVYGTYVKATVNGRGQVVSLVENLAGPGRSGVARAALGPEQALAAALRHHYPELQQSFGVAGVMGNVTRFARGDFFYRDPTATRVAIPMANGALRAGYLVETWDHRNMLWHTLVSGSGRILYMELRTNTNGGRFHIFPDHPGNSTQTTVSGPEPLPSGTPVGTTPSPLGWVSNNTTIGNNADAYLDRDNTNAADTNGRPVSSTRDFIYNADLAQDPTITVNQMAAVTNLFYLNNVIHDKLYLHGFTEAWRNFQTNNFSRGGAQNDPVNAEAQDGGGTNNANFATPSDGSRPRMQMYLWTQTTPRRDGDLDSDIVWHEYGHGLTWRMIGGMSGPFAGAIGEGMSDTLAIYINNNPVVGEYSYNRATGIRRYSYEDYPLTYGNVTGSSVHNDGEIYGGAMWRLRKMWLAAGHTDHQLFDVVIGGMKHTPSRPKYEDMRDGILVAANNLFPADSQARQCIVWEAFAASGIGEGAQGTESCNPARCSITITESFLVPAACAGEPPPPPNTAPTVSISSPENGSTYTEGDAVSFSGSASDTQDGNLSSSLAWTSSLNGNIGTGPSFSLDTLNVGTHLITAAVTDSGGLTGSASVSITVNSAGGGGGGITLSITGYKVRGTQHADLTWSGATSSTVDIYRDNAVLTTVTNSGAYTDNLNRKGGGSATYRVCEAGTSTCSSSVTVTF
jgi:extracellular elastinolytic metalloproteinase